MSRRHRRTAGFLFAALAPLAAAACATAQPGAAPPPPPAPPPTLSVVATGTVELPPDELQVSVSVVSEAPRADEALSQNNAQVNAVVAALHAIPLDADEVFTSNFSIQPIHGEYRGGQSPPIVGYRVTNSVLVRTDKLDMAGRIIQKGVEVGANQIGWVSFGLSGSQGRAEAIAEAAKIARADAQALASAMGVGLGPVRSLRVEPRMHFPVMRMERMVMADAGGGGSEPPITPGAVPVQATVSVEYEVVGGG